MTFNTIFRIGWRHLIRHPWQTSLMILGIVLGVTVAVSIDIANVSAGRAFELSTNAVTGNTTHQIVGGPEGVPESIFTTLRTKGIVKDAAPVISEYITSPNLGDRPLRLLGVDPFSESDFRANIIGDSQRQLANLVPLLNQADTILLSPGLAGEFGFAGCTGEEQQGLDDCEIDLNIAGSAYPVRIVGLINTTGGISVSQRLLEDILIADIATAQELIGREGRLDSIDLILPPECDPGSDTLQTANMSPCPELDRIRAALPSGVDLVPAASRNRALSEMTSAFKVNLTALSLLALIVGMFLIYNTMTFSVLQRRPVFGTLRCIGVTRWEIFLFVIGEALIIGFIGSLVGVGLGILLGQGAVRLVTQTINDLYFVVTVRGVQIPWTSLLKGGVLGVSATVLSAIPPAWEAASSPPQGAMTRNVLEVKAGRAVMLAGWIGLILLAVGSGLLAIPTRNLVVGFGGTLGVIVGFALLSPLVTRFLMRTLIRVVGRRSKALIRMAPRDVNRSLSRTSVAIAALTIAVSVTIGISLMVDSFRHTLITWLDETLMGDVYISVPSFTGTRSSNILDPEIIRETREWPGVERVDALRSVDVESPRGAIHVAATDNPTLVNERIFLRKIGTLETVNDALDNGSILISEPLANRLGLTGRTPTLQLSTESGLLEFPIAGVYYDYASNQGTVLMRLPVYRSHWSDEGITSLALRLIPGADPERVSSDLAREFLSTQDLQVRSNQTLRQEVLVIFDRTFAITGVLRLLAILVAFIGVLSALLSWQLEKRRDAGILRALGLTTRQIWLLILTETGLMGSVAGLLAVPTGLSLALILVYVINQRSFGWSLRFQAGVSPFILAFVISIAASLIAGFIPAWKMSTMEPAEVLRAE